MNTFVEQNKSVMNTLKLGNKYDSKRAYKVELIGSENGCAVLVTTYEPLYEKKAYRRR